MKNLRISVPLVNGELLDLYSDVTTGKALIQALLTSDWGAPPRCLVFEAKAEDGRTVEISIPYDERDTVHVHIGD